MDIGKAQLEEARLCFEKNKDLDRAANLVQQVLANYNKRLPFICRDYRSVCQDAGKYFEARWIESHKSTDFAQALRCYKFALAKDALFCMGQRCENGDDVPKNLDMALDVYLEAKTEAPIVELGKRHEFGDGIPIDLGIAMGYYYLPLQEGWGKHQTEESKLALIALGQRFETGDGLKINMFSAWNAYEYAGSGIDMLRIADLWSKKKNLFSKPLHVSPWHGTKLAPRWDGLSIAERIICCYGVAAIDANNFVKSGVVKRLSELAERAKKMEDKPTYESVAFKCFNTAAQVSIPASDHAAYALIEYCHQITSDDPYIDTVRGREFAMCKQLTGSELIWAKIGGHAMLARYYADYRKNPWANAEEIFINAEAAHLLYEAIEEAPGPLSVRCNAHACFILGDCYRAGYYRNQSDSMAHLYYRKAKELGHAEAAKRLSELDGICTIL